MYLYFDRTSALCMTEMKVLQCNPHPLVLHP